MWLWRFSPSASQSAASNAGGGASGGGPGGGEQTPSEVPAAAARQQNGAADPSAAGLQGCFQLLGCLPAHSSWVTALHWAKVAGRAANDEEGAQLGGGVASPFAGAGDTLALVTGAADGGVKLWGADVHALAGAVHGGSSLPW